jgi:hypothetical protein
MVGSETNRTHMSAAPTFERQTRALRPPAEGPAEPTQAEEHVSATIRDPFWSMSLVASGATIAAMWGLGTLVLAILGLSGVLTKYMLPVGGIVLGLGFLILGGVSALWSRMWPEHGTSWERGIFSSGVGAVLIAGLAAVVLGLLNFAFLGDARFGAVAVIVLGLGLLWHSRVMRRVSRCTHYLAYHDAEGHRPTGPFAVNALSLAPVRDFLVGLGGVILGILAMMNVVPVVLGFVALLTIGGALTFTASTICAATLTTVKGVCAKS